MHYDFACIAKLNMWKLLLLSNCGIIFRNVLFVTLSEFACLKVLKNLQVVFDMQWFYLLQLVEKYGRFVQSFLKRAIETKSKKCNGERNLRELIR